MTRGAAPARYRRLLPEPGDLVSAAEALDGLGLVDLASADRPYLVLNMVATVDGRATLDGRTAPMSSEPDRQMFHALRAQVDAVMVGAGTVRVERYRRLVRDRDLRALRRSLGLAEDPLAVVVSASLGIPPDLPLLQEPEQRVLVITASEGELEGVEATVTYLRPPAGQALRLAPMLARLRSEHGIRAVLCEGGPHLNGSLLQEGLVDELFLSTAPKLAGSAGDLNDRDGRRPGRAAGREARVAAGVARRAVRPLRDRRRTMSDREPLEGIAAGDAHLGRSVPLPTVALPLVRWVEVWTAGPRGVEVEWNLDDSRPGAPGRLALYVGHQAPGERGLPDPVPLGRYAHRTAPLAEAEPGLRPVHELAWEAEGLHLRLTAQGPWALEDLVAVAESVAAANSSDGEGGGAPGRRDKLDE